MLLLPPSSRWQQHLLSFSLRPTRRRRRIVSGSTGRAARATGTSPPKAHPVGRRTGLSRVGALPSVRKLGRRPRRASSSSFQQICGSTEPVEGKKRVGLVIDFGTDADAPSGQTPPNGPVARCVVAPTTANGYEILASVTSLRVDAGMICGVAGYPTSGCGEAVKSPKPTKNPQPDPSSSNAGGSSTPSANPQNSSANASNNGDRVPADDGRGWQQVQRLERQEVGLERR